MQTAQHGNGSTVLFYLSEAIGAKVVGPSDERLGNLRDVIVQVGGEPFPRVKALVVAVGGIATPVFVPWDSVASIDARIVRLLTTRIDLHPFERREGEVLVAGDVLDRQIVDVAGRRVVRVNDAQLRSKERRVGKECRSRVSPYH